MFGAKSVVVPMTDLSQNVYVFNLIDRSGEMEVRLTEFRHEVKPTKRHQWRVQQTWSHYSHRGSTCNRPEPSDEIYGYAIRHFQSLIVREPAAQPVTGGRG